MSDDFSLLGHLGVSVPTVTTRPPPPRAQQRVTTSRILVPKEKPPLPFRDGADSARRVRRPPTSGTNIITGEHKPMFVPTGEVRTEKTHNGALQTEYHIYNSNLPSNMAYNAMMADKHRQDKLHAHDAAAHYDPTQNSMSFEDHTSRMSAEERARYRVAQQNDLDARQQHKNDAKAQRVASERRAMEQTAETEAAAKANEYAMKKETMQQAAAQQKDLLQRARDAKLAKRKAEIGTVSQNQGMSIGEVNIDQAALRERRDELQECWRHQMSERVSRAQNDKARDNQLQLAAVSLARDEADAERRTRAEAVAVMQAQHSIMERRKEEAATQKQNQLANERRMLQDDAQRRRAEMAQEHQAKMQERSAMQASIQKQLAEKELQKKAQQTLNRAVERGNDRFARRTQHDVLMRCPVSKQLLPPSHYNIPINQRPTPMLTLSEGKVTDLRNQTF